MKHCFARTGSFFKMHLSQRFVFRPSIVWVYFSTLPVLCDSMVNGNYCTIEKYQQQQVVVWVVASNNAHYFMNIGFTVIIIMHIMHLFFILY